MASLSSTTCKIDKQGRIVIPSSWRDRHKISGGEEILLIEEADGRLSLRTRMQGVRRAQQIIQEAIPGNDSLVEELYRERRRERALEERALGRGKQVRVRSR